MAAPITMDVKPITTPHLDLDHLLLTDKDFQTKETSVLQSPIKQYYRYRDQYLNQANKIGLWESDLPKYQFLEVHIFPEIIHYFQANYIPIQRAIMSPDHTILFTITVKSVNEMLQLQPGQNLTLISIRDLLDKFRKLTTTRLLKCFRPS